MANVTKINIGDTFKDFDSAKINIGDSWKDVESIQINIGDSWKDVILAIDAWNVSTASYDSKYKSTYSECASMYGVTFKSDGLIMYVMGYGCSEVNQYTLSTAWDVSTASYASKRADISSEVTYPKQVVLSSDGTKMYIVGGSDYVYQYTLSTAWDVSTASYASLSKDVTSEESIPRSIFLSPDGTKMYIGGITNEYVYQYTLSTAWDVSTASYASKYADCDSECSAVNAIFFSSDGTRMYIMGYLPDDRVVFQYTLSTAWDASTASYASLSFNVGDRGGDGRGVWFKSDGTKMYITDGDPEVRVYQYSISG